MSAVRGLSLPPLVPPPPGMILRWTVPLLLGIVAPAVGRIGLRRSATRAPAGRLYARGRGLRRGGPALFCPPPGVGRQGAKLRGPGGRAPRGGGHLLVLQVVLPEANRHAAVQAQLDHHTPAPL